MTTRQALLNPPQSPLKQVFNCSGNEPHPSCESRLVASSELQGGIRYPDSLQVHRSGWGKGYFILEKSRNRGIKELDIKKMQIVSANTFPPPTLTRKHEGW